MKNNNIILIFVLAFATLTISCKKNADEVAIIEVAKGTIVGKVVAADNITPIKNASVFIDSKGKIYLTKTNNLGEYSLLAPIGNQKLFIQSNNGKMFRTVLNVTIKENITTSLPSAKLAQVAKLGFVSGSYDKIEEIIVNSLGYTALPITNLNNFNSLLQYDAIFLNCSSSITLNSTISLNLANFVSNGGSLYVSDWAVAYLIGSNVSGAICPYVRPDGFIPDNTICATRSGIKTIMDSALITSADLSTYLNKQAININYDLPMWEQINSVDTAFWEIMVRNPSNGLPLLVRTNKFTNSSAGNYNVGAYDSTYVTICHNEQGLAIPWNLTINKADLPLHLAHGDNVGGCANINAGRIYFTTFHNEAGGVINNDTKEILKYVILNL